MLVPNLLDLETDLNALGWAVAGLDGLAGAYNAVTLLQQRPALPWIDTAERNYAQGRLAAQSWLDARVDVISQARDSVVSYADLAEGAAAAIDPTDSTDDWIDRLDALRLEASSRDD